MTGSARTAARTLRESAHTLRASVSHTYGVRRYAGSGWWDGVPHEEGRRP